MRTKKKAKSKVKVIKAKSNTDFKLGDVVYYFEYNRIRKGMLVKMILEEKFGGKLSADSKILFSVQNMNDGGYRHELDILFPTVKDALTYVEKIAEV